MEEGRSHFVYKERCGLDPLTFLCVSGAETNLRERDPGDMDSLVQLSRLVMPLKAPTLQGN